MKSCRVLRLLSLDDFNYLWWMASLFLSISFSFRSELSSRSFYRIEEFLTSFKVRNEALAIGDFEHEVTLIFRSDVYPE